MNIVLKQQDADFILMFLRNDLKRIIEADKGLEYKFAKLKKQHETNKGNAFADLLMDTAAMMTRTVNERSSEVRKDLEHCIELLVCGSENAETATSV